MLYHLFSSSFSSTDPATTAIYTLSLHDALPIFPATDVASSPYTAEIVDFAGAIASGRPADVTGMDGARAVQDRKSTRLNSSHVAISYAVFCLKKKNKKRERTKIRIQRGGHDNQQ